MHCSSCGERYVEGAKFCGKCGAVRLPEPGSYEPWRGEKRRITGWRAALLSLGLSALTLAVIGGTGLALWSTLDLGSDSEGTNGAGTSEQAQSDDAPPEPTGEAAALSPALAAAVGVHTYDSVGEGDGASDNSLVTFAISIDGDQLTLESIDFGWSRTYEAVGPDRYYATSVGDSGESYQHFLALNEGGHVQHSEVGGSVQIRYTRTFADGTTAAPATTAAPEPEIPIVTATLECYEIDQDGLPAMDSNGAAVATPCAVSGFDLTWQRAETLLSITPLIEDGFSAATGEVSFDLSLEGGLFYTACTFDLGCTFEDLGGEGIVVDHPFTQSLGSDGTTGTLGPFSFGPEFRYDGLLVRTFVVSWVDRIDRTSSSIWMDWINDPVGPQVTGTLETEGAVRVGSAG